MQRAEFLYAAGMPSQSYVVHDPKVLRAIAHPVRNRILTELGAQGSLRAADIARELGIPANQASFHLRQLAKYGLVEEDPAAARDRRDRVWRPAAAGLTVNLKDLEESPGGKAASAVYRRNAASWGQLIIDTALNRREPGTHTSLSDSALRLTKDEASQLSFELNEVVERWAERNRGSDDSRRTYLYYAAILPHPKLEPDDR